MLSQTETEDGHLRRVLLGLAKELAKILKPFNVGDSMAALAGRSLQWRVSISATLVRPI